MEFPTSGPSTAGASAEEHARLLLQSPGDASIPGYPPSLLPRSDAAVALDPGPRPVVLVFYDDGARASSLQAAEFLPVLARHRGRADFVAIDVSASSRWSAEERRLVRKYYMAVVPTTVVLDRARAPLLLKFQRIAGAALEDVLESAPR
jgi:hypothetical protein